MKPKARRIGILIAAFGLFASGCSNDNKEDVGTDGSSDADADADNDADADSDADADADSDCGRPIGSCSAPSTTVSEVEVGVQVTGYGREGDTEPFPMALAAMPSGGTRLAWLGTDQKVYVAQLDCNDRLIPNTTFSFPAVNLQDIYADDEGGVLLLTRDATNGGVDNCGNGRLCGGSSSPCRTMWMLRYNNSGTVEWETQVTNLSDSLAGYDNGARFVWWYQHHGRIAFDGSNYAAYFCIAITVNNGNCVDIHEGDRMQVVASNGSPVRHPDAFEVGCSHSWGTRIVWDPRAGRFVMVCVTDNMCRIAQPSPYRTVAEGECDGTLFGGDLVLSSESGYWTAWSQGEQIRLERFEGNDPSNLTISNAGASRHPHLVSYGTKNMLLAWESDSGIRAQVRNAGDGSTIGNEFSIDVPDHDFFSFKAYPDGSVAVPASGSSSTSIRIARVNPCN